MAYTIGQLARLSGVPVKTIRFYSDEDLLPPTGRSAAGHRRYSETDLARLQLIRSLRELGVDLGTIARALDGHAGLGDLLDAHIRTLETRIRALQRQLVVLRAAGSSPSVDTVRRVQALAQLDAAERRALLDRFWDSVVGPQPPEPVANLRARGTVALPDDPTPEQLDAWIELAELAADEDFQRTTRQNAEWLGNAAGTDGADEAALASGMADATNLAAAALEAGIEPHDPRAEPAARAMVAAYAVALSRTPDDEFGRWLVEQHERHTDPRAARYWALVARISGYVSTPEEERTLARYPWLIEAVKALVARTS